MHVHVDASVDLRARRYMAKEDGSEDAFHRAEAHSVEQNVRAMEDLADSTVTNAGTLRELDSRLRKMTGEGTPCR